MAGTKISEATLRSTLQGTESLPIVDTDLAAGRTTIDDVKAYVQPDLSEYAKTSDIPDLSNYALKSEIPTVPANVSELTNDAGYITSSALSDYAKTSDIPDTSSFVTNTSLESTLADYAKTADIPDTSDMLTKTEAANTYQAKGDYATTTDLSGKVSGTGVTGISVVTTLPESQDEGVLYIVTGEE